MIHAAVIGVTDLVR